MRPQSSHKSWRYILW